MLERETGFEPATLALARRCSTTELFPLEQQSLEAWDITDTRTKLSRDLAGWYLSLFFVTPFHCSQTLPKSNFRIWQTKLLIYQMFASLLAV